MTVQDLLRHTSGLTYDHTGNGPVQKLYQESRLRSRKITNAEHATMIAGMPLMCQPGAEWNYSRSTDVLGRIIEVVSGKSLGAFLTERILAPLQMAETAFHTPEANAGRLAEPFATDPWNGDKVQLFNMLEKPAMESGGGGLVSTTMDYARFSQMLLNGGTLDGNRIIGRKTLELMASDHLSAGVKVDSPLMPPGHGFGLGFAVRTHRGVAPFPGSLGQFFWSGMAGTFFFIDPAEELFTGVHDAGPRPARIYSQPAAGPGLRGGGVSGSATPSPSCPRMRGIQSPGTPIIHSRRAWMARLADDDVELRGVCTQLN